MNKLGNLPPLDDLQDSEDDDDMDSEEFLDMDFPAPMMALTKKPSQMQSLTKGKGLSMSQQINRMTCKHTSGFKDLPPEMPNLQAKNSSEIVPNNTLKEDFTINYEI